MYLKLGKDFSFEERELINNKLCEISLGNRLSCSSDCWHKWTNILYYGYHGEKHQEHAISKESQDFRHPILMKLIDILLNDDASFIGIIMIDITNILQLSLILGDAQQIERRDKIKDKIYDCLKNDEQVCKKLITDFYDLHILTEFGLVFIKRILKLLYDRDYLVNFSLTLDKIYQQIEFYPSFTRFTILSLAKNETLIGTIFKSIVEVDKLSQHLIKIDQSKAKVQTVISKLPPDLNEAFRKISLIMIKSSKKTD
jgi:hypothetical protein